MRCSCHGAIAAVLLAGLLAAPPGEASPWLRFRSSRLVIVGDAPERDLRRVAERIETFRAALQSTFPSATVGVPVPVTVVVFATDSGFTPFKPLVRGRPMDRVAGLFLGAEDSHVIALSLAHGEAAYETVLHEYTHAVVAETMRAVPVWLNEGLAEVYSTYTARADGRTAVIGLPPDRLVRELQSGTPLPLETLLAVEVGSPLYTEGERRGMFYAQSWALTHYLLLHAEARRAQLPIYLRLRDDGASIGDAIRGAFGCEPDVLDRELREYSRAFIHRGIDVPIDRPPPTSPLLRAETITASEAATYTAEIYARQGRDEVARAAIDEVLRTDRDSPRALAALGRLYLRARRFDDALPLLGRAAAALPEDAQVASALARAHVERLSGRARQDVIDDRELVLPVRQALDRAAALDPDDAYLLAMRGYVELLARNDLERAESLLVRATRLAPARLEYRLLLGQVYLEQRNLAGAQAVIGPVAARADSPELGARARALLARAAADAGVTPDVARVSRQPLLLRTVSPGETRVTALFEGVTCGGEGAALQLRLDGRLLTLRANPLERIDFINYGDEPVDPLGCRMLAAPVRVVATFTGALDGLAEAVAIEIVPADFALP